MVGRDYLLEKPAPPSEARRIVHQVVVPRIIDAAGALERGVERLAVGARETPLLVLGAAALFGAALGALHAGRTARR